MFGDNPVFLPLNFIKKHIIWVNKYDNYFNLEGARVVGESSIEARTCDQGCPIVAKLLHLGTLV